MENFIPTTVEIALMQISVFAIFIAGVCYFALAALGDWLGSRGISKGTKNTVNTSYYIRTSQWEGNLFPHAIYNSEGACVMAFAHKEDALAMLNNYNETVAI